MLSSKSVIAATDQQQHTAVLQAKQGAAEPWTLSTPLQLLKLQSNDAARVEAADLRRQEAGQLDCSMFWAVGLQKTRTSEVVAAEVERGDGRELANLRRQEAGELILRQVDARQGVERLPDGGVERQLAVQRQARQIPAAARANLSHPSAEVCQAVEQYQMEPAIQRGSVELLLRPCATLARSAGCCC